ncbi:MAG: hypothetical protein ACR2QC_09240 [Gammaproteobacteria bacterium]
MHNYPPLCGGGDSCLRRNGTGGAAEIRRRTAEIGGAERGIPTKKTTADGKFCTFFRSGEKNGIRGDSVL